MLMLETHHLPIFKMINGKALLQEPSNASSVLIALALILNPQVADLTGDLGHCLDYRLDGRKWSSRTVVVGQDANNRCTKTYGQGSDITRRFRHTKISKYQILLIWLYSTSTIDFVIHLVASYP